MGIGVSKFSKRLDIVCWQHGNMMVSDMLVELEMPGAWACMALWRVWRVWRVWCVQLRHRKAKSGSLDGLSFESISKNPRERPRRTDAPNAQRHLRSEAVWLHRPVLSMRDKNYENCISCESLM